MFERVGRGVAHDEYIDFEVKGGVHQIVSPISNYESTNIYYDFFSTADKLRKKKSVLDP